MLPNNAKEITGFPNYYATPDGDIWSGPKKSFTGYRKLKPHALNKQGHVSVQLFKNGPRIWRQIHRLILETFVGPCPEGMECCHHNDISSDNRLENLRWDTHSNNMKDSFRNGKQNNKGENNSVAKLNTWQVRIIKQLLKYPKEFSQKRIGEMFAVTKHAICDIKNKRAWSHI